MVPRVWLGTCLLCLIGFSGCAPRRLAVLIPPAALHPETDHDKDADRDDDDEAETRARSIEWFNKRHPDGGLRARAVTEKERQMAAAAGTSGQWNAIGPQPIHSYGSVYSGRVWGIAVDPRNSSVVYVGTDGGGVWGTTNGGVNWLPLTDTQANINIRDLALAPSAPDTIFAATYGGGVLKSANDGVTWATSLPGSYVYSIAVHPTNASIVLAATGSVSRSADGGVTWTTQLAGENCTQVLFDPANGNAAYAATTNGGLYYSADSGVSWNPTGTTGLPAGPFSAITVAVAPSVHNILYLALKGTNDLLLGFYKSFDSGATWSAIGVPAKDNVTYWGWSLRVNPSNPNIVYAGSLLLSMSTDGGMTWVENDSGLHVDHHIQAYSADGSILYIGSDGGIWSASAPTAPGTTWNSLNSTLNTALFYPGISVSPLTESTALGGTQDNGILQYSGSLAWNEIACGDGGFTAIDFVSPQNLYGACQNIQIEASTNGGVSFQSAQSGINTSDPVDFIPPLVMDPSSSSRLYFGTNRVYQTVNGAASWTAISPDLTRSSNSGIATIAIAPSDPNTVYTGSVNGAIYISRNALAGTGATWTAVNLPVSQGVTWITVDPQNPLIAWAASATYEGNLYRTVNGGSSWTKTNSGLPAVTVNDIVIDPDVADTVYAATDIGVYRSVDNGQSWLPLGTGLPNVIAHSLQLYRPSRTLRVATYGRGMWDLSVPIAGQVSVTIASSAPGAYFSLEDGTTYQAPTSFDWYTGAQHTVTWLNGSNGTRLVFSGWSDGFVENARTITVPSSAITYTGNGTLQFLLSIAYAPAAGGTVTASPASPDGYYNSGTTVSLAGSAVPGYGFWYYSGDASGYTPASVTMTAPRHVTANFYCSYQFYGLLPSTLGPGAGAGQIVYTLGSGCASGAMSNTAWLTAGTPAADDTLGTISWAAAANTGASRSATIAFSGSDSFTYSMNATQSAVGTATPDFVSLTPNSGSGGSPVFSFQIRDASGYADLGNVTLSLMTPGGGAQCYVIVYPGTAVSNFYLLNDAANNYLGPLTVPGTGTLSNSSCSVKAANSSATGSGNVLTVNIGMSFTAPFAGDKYTNAGATSKTAGYSYGTLGTWIVPPGTSQTVTFGPPGNVGVGAAPFNLTATASSGLPVSFASTTSGVCTVTTTGLVTIVGQGTCTVTASQAGNATYAPASVTQSFMVLPDQLTVTASPSGSGTVTFSPASSGNYYASGMIVCATAVPAAGYIFTGWSGIALDAAGCFVTTGSATITASFKPNPITAASALRFVPVSPCRLVDTRNAAGPLGGPSLGAGTARSFTIPGTCNIPAKALAYSLNLTVVPQGTLGYVTLWPTGQPQPVVSTLNSIDGRVKSNAAVVPAGTGGAVSVYATNTTDAILDINGYFDSYTDTSALQFYPLTPCRVADTRNTSGPLGGPSLAASQARAFPVLSSACGVPSNALAYSLNFTAIPQGPLGYLTVWPAGQGQPVVSTLNALTGAVTANAAVVPAGTGGAINLYATDKTDMVIDINGYFAAPGSSGLSLYNLAPCRIEDTRLPAGTPAFTGTATETATGVACGVPPEARALVLNATVVPSGVLGYLSLWANGGSQPVVSTLNSLDGSVTSNMAVVPTTNGLVNAYAAGPGTTYLIADTSGYFAP